MLVAQCIKLTASDISLRISASTGLWLTIIFLRFTISVIFIFFAQASVSGAQWLVGQRLLDISIAGGFGRFGFIGSARIGSGSRGLEEIIGTGLATAAAFILLGHVCAGNTAGGAGSAGSYAGWLDNFRRIGSNTAFAGYSRGGG